MMTAGGINRTTRIKLTGMITPEKIPKVLIGSKGENVGKECYRGGT